MVDHVKGALPKSDSPGPAPLTSIVPTPPTMAKAKAMGILKNINTKKVVNAMILIISESKF